VTICPQCGKTLPDGAVFCFACGTPIPHQSDVALPINLQQETLRPGTVVCQDYVIEGLQQVDDLGERYRATHHLTGQQVTVELLAGHIAADPEFRSRILSEARILAKLHHPNIPIMYNLREENGRFVVVLEQPEGRSLDRILSERGTISALKGIPLMDQVLSGLEHAHSLNLVHGRLRPSLMFVSDEDRVMVTGFGFLQSLQTRGSAGLPGHIPTPAYMAPEQALGQPVDQRTDLYLAAVLFFEMLAGRPPFTGTSDYEILRGHVEQPPRDLRELVPTVPPVVSAVIARALVKQPDGRFQTANQFRVALRRAERDSMNQRILMSAHPKPTETKQGLASPGVAGPDPAAFHQTSPAGGAAHMAADQGAAIQVAVPHPAGPRVMPPPSADPVAVTAPPIGAPPPSVSLSYDMRLTDAQKDVLENLTGTSGTRPQGEAVPWSDLTPPSSASQELRRKSAVPSSGQREPSAQSVPSGQREPSGQSVPSGQRKPSGQSPSPQRHEPKVEQPVAGQPARQPIANRLTTEAGDGAAPDRLDETDGESGTGRHATDGQAKRGKKSSMKLAALSDERDFFSSDQNAYQSSDDFSDLEDEYGQPGAKRAKRLTLLVVGLVLTGLGGFALYHFVFDSYANVAKEKKEARSDQLSDLPDPVREARQKAAADVGGQPRQRQNGMAGPSGPQGRGTQVAGMQGPGAQGLASARMAPPRPRPAGASKEQMDQVQKLWKRHRGQAVGMLEGLAKQFPADQRVKMLLAKHYENRAWSALNAGNYRRAERAARKAVAVDPMTRLAWFCLGYSLKERGARQDAARAFATYVARCVNAKCRMLNLAKRYSKP